MFKVRVFEDDDLQLLGKWLNKKYIKKWFEVQDVCTIDDWLYEVKNRKDKFKWLNHFIALCGDCPIGFCVYYKCVDAKEEWYGDISLDGAYSMDYLIGEEDYLGRGFGKKMVEKLMEMIFSHKDAERIIVQPDKGNKASCGVLLKNGFILEDNIYGITKVEYKPYDNK